MLLIALRDLQFRLRRFVISVVAVALVLALTLLLSGVAASFDAEVDRTLDQLGAGAWVVDEAATGPLLGAVPLLDDAVAQVAALDGVERAGPLGLYSTTITEGGGPQPLNVFGVGPGAIGSPTPDEGASLAASGQAVVDAQLGRDVGETIEIGGRTFDVVGRFDDSTVLGGTPNAFVSIDDLQDLAYAGAPVILSIAIDGDPGELPGGLALQRGSDAHADLVRPVEPAKETITLITILLWLVTGCIIGSVIYLSALERVRDFAVFKAIGVSTRWIFSGLLLQAVLLSVVSSLLAIVTAWLLAPTMSIPVVLPMSALVIVPVTAVVVSMVASLAGVRRAVQVDPALAFG